MRRRAGARPTTISHVGVFGTLWYPAASRDAGLGEGPAFALFFLLPLTLVM